MDRSAPKSLRLHVGIFGRRNVGKSSVLNAICRQQVAIVSDEPGTTTDPVRKPMELLPLGPIVLIDTAGLDDPGDLGELRVQRSRKVLRSADMALLVATADTFDDQDWTLLDDLKRRKIPVVVVLNKIDESVPSDELLAQLRDRDLPVVQVCAIEPDTIDQLRAAIMRHAPESFLATSVIAADLVGKDELAILVVPIDKEAPRGRIILPQVQTIRDLLDADAMSLVVKQHHLPAILARLRSPPKLVVTDSQAFGEVAANVPNDIPLTSFSILFARFKGDLPTQAAGAAAIAELRDGDTILVAESCSHHPIADDIGTVKLPNWLRSRTGCKLTFEHAQGQDFPEDLSPYRMVIQCGACTFNRREVLNRIAACRAAGVPITNYGLAIAFCLGIFDRALEPFPEARAAWRNSQRQRSCHG